MKQEMEHSKGSHSGPKCNATSEWRNEAIASFCDSYASVVYGRNRNATISKSYLKSCRDICIYQYVYDAWHKDMYARV